ncbi:spindle assembly abnormal protein 6 homolog [Hydractinia symbiolongicarpus]|uniref:spindle assembly abnormal protein 6 homolog n=1 Tax=Hydractinia symbiolongicarpus TaxID=13093 RepID=UPI00254B22DE|nr:spindle assembly abnormal protein 6 homolog [Hydractinia symbiolongicarpus]
MHSTIMSVSENTLFSKSVTVLLKDYEQRKTVLNIAVSLRPTSSAIHHKELYVQLTDSTDLFFLQTLTLSEDDFQNLKNQQGLLVDFSAFPQKFIDLLELCITEQNNTVPRFLLHFTTSSASHGVLDVVETNPFKHLVHLSLKFVVGNNEEIKNYLALCLKSLKEEKTVLEKNFSSKESELSNRLSSTNQILADRTRELDELKIQLRDKLGETTSQLNEQVSREKQNQEKLRHSYEERLKNERLTFDERYNKTVRELENRLRESQTNNKDLTDQKYKYESLIRELKSRVSSLEEERHVTSRDLQTLRRQNTNLDSDRHERDKTLNHLRTRVAVLEQELKDKTQVIKRTNDLLESANEQKSRFEVDVEKKQTQITQLEDTVRSVSAEVIKGNEIIQKLQTEMKALKPRVKMMNIVTTKQERLIEEKDLILSQKEKEHREDKKVINNLQDQLAEMKKKMDDTNEKLNESQETLKNNENVINWLNKQLNEQTINKLSSTHNSTLSTSNQRIPYVTRTSPSSLPQQTIPGYNTRMEGSIRTTNPITAIPPRLAQQAGIPYRPILKKPQFEPDNISPIVSQLRNPLRPKQMSTPVINEESEPVLDPKYLMRKKPETKSNPSNIDENADPNLQQNNSDNINPRGAKPFVLPSSYFPTQKGST